MTHSGKLTSDLGPVNEDKCTEISGDLGLKRHNSLGAQWNLDSSQPGIVGAQVHQQQGLSELVQSRLEYGRVPTQLASREGTDIIVLPDHQGDRVVVIPQLPGEMVPHPHGVLPQPEHLERPDKNPVCSTYPRPSRSPEAVPHVTATSPRRGEVTERVVRFVAALAHMADTVRHEQATRCL